MPDNLAQLDAVHAECVRLLDRLDDCFSMKGAPAAVLASAFGRLLAQFHETRAATLSAACALASPGYVGPPGLGAENAHHAIVAAVERFLRRMSLAIERLPRFGDAAAAAALTNAQAKPPCEEGAIELAMRLLVLNDDLAGAAEWDMTGVAWTIAHAMSSAAADCWERGNAVYGPAGTGADLIAAARNEYRALRSALMREQAGGAESRLYAPSDSAVFKRLGERSKLRTAARDGRVRTRKGPGNSKRWLYHAGDAAELWPGKVDLSKICG